MTHEGSGGGLGEIKSVFEDIGSEIGSYAYDLLDELSADLGEIGDSRAWAANDYNSLEALVAIESLDDIVSTEADGPLSEQARRYNSLRTSLHAALPFGETERQWLVGLYGSLCVHPKERTVDIIRESQADLVTAGLRKTVSGDDLLRRWWSWRREADEYTGQGTLDMAREVLREIVGTLSPDQGLPETYVQLDRA